MGQPLHPSEFIALTTTHKGSPHTTWSLALSYASGTTSSCLSMPKKGGSPVDTRQDRLLP